MNAPVDSTGRPGMVGSRRSMSCPSKTEANHLAQIADNLDLVLKQINMKRSL